MRLRRQVSQEGRSPRGRRRRVHPDRAKSSHPGNASSLPLPPVLHLPNRVTPVLRDGVPQRRRSHVPHTEERTLLRGQGEVLRRRNLVGFDIFTQKGNSLPGSQAGQRTLGLRGTHQDCRLWYVQATDIPGQDRRHLLRDA